MSNEEVLYLLVYISGYIVTCAIHYYMDCVLKTSNFQDTDFYAIAVVIWYAVLPFWVYELIKHYLARSKHDGC